ncbi:uncharacterized protein Pyn_24364 [Prunus yedoensis var. nudiflora]|uniref:Uncharacterized protein n=1 Tax=Prunus yedoensis var. nudiflora TaxID=2094558 RepID=A0A314ZMX6_PRUYE|nr:uncharacterized protein Pyn_24364 [Prunus yedoensis var. nudiflora]
MKTRKARTRTTVCHDEEESADSLDSDFADPNFSCDDNDDDVDFDEWVDKQTEWVGDGAKEKEPESTNGGVDSGIGVQMLNWIQRSMILIMCSLNMTLMMTLQ